MTPPSKWVGRWLVAWAAFLFLLVLIGGGTRLTESGLSITEWNPVAGVLPPMSDAAWTDAFARYKEIPQGKLNAAMTIDQFRAIYWWEFVHRLWARLVGVIGLVPWLWFFYRGQLPRPLATRCAQIVALIGVQGALGWYMVASGLVERVEVSQYRLAAHLSLAIVIYLLAVWTAADVLNDNSELAVARRSLLVSRSLTLLVALAGLTLVSGAFVAGLRAGKIYNTFPMMGAGLVPAEWGQLAPWWKNPLENPAAAQFDHRVLAVLTFLAVVVAWLRLRPRAATVRLKRLLDLVLGAATLQVALGISTLLLAVPVGLGVAHQGGALLLLTALTLAQHAARTEPAR